MKKLDYLRAEDFACASELCSDNDSYALAGGSDILGRCKDDIFVDYPRVLVDLKRIPNSAYVTLQENDKAKSLTTEDTSTEPKLSENINTDAANKLSIHIGANTTLATLAESDLVKTHIPALAQAAHSVATPLIRNIATVAGNLCQDVRCWFYRYPHEAGGRIQCLRKGGDNCYAILGDNRYHSVFGGLSCGATPCTKKCPAATAIPEYMAQLRQDNLAGATQILLDVNPMPALTSRVCAHFCQESCNQTKTGESVAIRNVERMVGDFALENKELFYKAPQELSNKTVAIVGSGPAGLSAAYYLRLTGLSVTVYESKEKPGGMLLYAIPNYRLPKDIVHSYTAALTDMGIKFVCSTNVGKDIEIKDLEDTYDAIYFATGTWKRPVLGLTGEELTVFGLDFLVEVHKWMNGKVGTEVVVTGGGNVAMDVAITAKRLGAKKVILACLETEAEMPAGKEEIARAKEEGVSIYAGWGLSKVISEDNKVTGMELKRCVSVYDSAHRFAPVYDETDKMVIAAENILMAVGQLADLSFLDDKYTLELTNRGLIDVVQDSQMTSHKGIFAGGDVTTGPSTVIDCVATGHSAARGILRYLEVDTKHKCTSMQSQTDFLLVDTAGIKKTTALKLKELSLSERTLDKEDEFAPDKASALQEAARCLNCGCYAVDPSDIAPVLVALDATIHTTKRTISAHEFFCTELKVSDVLDSGELVTEIVIDVPLGAVSAYDKFRLRDAIDFAMYSLASVVRLRDGVVDEVRLVLGGCAPVPIVCTEAMDFLKGKSVTCDSAEEAAALAVSKMFSMGHNEYKIIGVKAMIRDALLGK